jgi:hypothetical protein
MVKFIKMTARFLAIGATYGCVTLGLLDQLESNKDFDVFMTSNFPILLQCFLLAPHRRALARSNVTGHVRYGYATAPDLRTKNSFKLFADRYHINIDDIK